MKFIEFTITATPPIANTVDGLTALEGMTSLVEYRALSFPQTPEDKERAAKLRKKSDIGVFSFRVNQSESTQTCNEIASRVLGAAGGRDMQILVQTAEAEDVISLRDLDVEQLASQILTVITRTYTISGVWSYQSFLILPTATELDAPPGTFVTTKKWALGQLAISDNTNDEFSGELVFAPGVKLNVKGRVLLSTNSTPLGIEAIGEGLEGPTKGAIYRINGWVVPPSSNQTKRPNIHGSVLAIRGSDSKPDVELGGKPVGTVGAFILA